MYACTCDRYNHKSGEWAHTTRLTRFPERVWLSNIDFFSPPSSLPQSVPTSKLSGKVETSVKLLEQSLGEWGVPSLSVLFNNMLVVAHKELETASKVVYNKAYTGADGGQGLGTADDLRWFLLASDIPSASSSLKDEEFIPMAG